MDMEQMNYDDLWTEIERHGVPCRIMLSCDLNKTYTGPGMEYTPLWSVENKNVPLLLEEVRRGKEQVLWGRLKNGDGWIELKDVQLCENE